MSDPNQPKCDLCDDTGLLLMRSQCHPAAPLRAKLWTTSKGEPMVSLYCYVPDCSRHVVSCRVAEFFAVAPDK